jgi:hypothetical protein
MIDDCGDRTPPRKPNFDNPRPKPAEIFRIPEDEFKAVLEKLNLADSDKICALAFFRNNGRDGLVLSEGFKLSSSHEHDAPRGQKCLAGSITTIAAVPVTGSNCSVITINGMLVECCDE